MTVCRTKSDRTRFQRCFLQRFLLMILVFSIITNVDVCAQDFQTVSVGHRRFNSKFALQSRGGAIPLQKCKRNENASSSATNKISNSDNARQVKKLRKPPFSRKPKSTTSSMTENQGMVLLIRVLFLVYYGSLGSLMPYLPVYYHSLGHGGQIIGMLGAVKPLTTFLVAPLWGIISDQTHSPFRILKVTFLVSFVGQLLVSAYNDHWYIMIMVFLTALFNAPVKSLIDSMVMGHLSDQSQYGRLRLWGQMGFGLGSSGVGLLLSRSKGAVNPDASTFSDEWTDTLSSLPIIFQSMIEYVDHLWQNLTGYKLLFSTYAFLSIPTWIAIQKFQRLDQDAQKIAEKFRQVKKRKSMESGKEGTKIMDGLWLLLHDSDAILFFFLVFVVGLSSGIIENFAYVRIREVGGTGKEMGISRLVSSIAGAPMFWFSGTISQALGADRVLVLSLISYIVRFLIYAVMQSPFQGLPAEALRGLTFAAFWSTGTVYAHKIAPDGMQATMLMFLNAMYGGLGQSIGAIVGGKMQSKVGTVKTFLYSAAADCCFVGFMIFYLSMRKSSSFRNPTPIVAKSRKDR